MSNPLETSIPTVDPTSPGEVEAAVAAALAGIAEAADLDELKLVRLAHTGDKSPLALANRAIGKLDKSAEGCRRPADRPGPRPGQQSRSPLARSSWLRNATPGCSAQERVDVTLPFDRRPPGARHPISAVMEDIEDIFVGMGWEVAEGPELEAEWFNFDALNFGPDHPARAMQDTFYVAGPDGAGIRTGAAHAHLARADPHDARPRNRRST